MKNHFTGIRRSYFFSAPSLLVYFTELTEKHALLFEKLFGRAPAGFSRELALGVLSNAPYISFPFYPTIRVAFKYMFRNFHMFQIPIAFLLARLLILRFFPIHVFVNAEKDYTFHPFMCFVNAAFRRDPNDTFKSPTPLLIILSSKLYKI